MGEVSWANLYCCYEVLLRRTRVRLVFLSSYPQFPIYLDVYNLTTHIKIYYLTRIQILADCMLIRFISITLVLVCFSCKETTVKKENKLTKAFDSFISKEKFQEDMTIHYPGISAPALKPILTDKINQAAEDLRETSLKLNPTKEDYLRALEKGLSGFDRYTPFDTEDRERAGHYFEELMQIVGLESSGGRLNKFLYGFDPDKQN